VAVHRDGNERAGGGKGLKKGSTAITGQLYPNKAMLVYSLFKGTLYTQMSLPSRTAERQIHCTITLVAY